MKLLSGRPLEMSKAIEENELVWAKMRGYPHWPAKVSGYNWWCALIREHTAVFTFTTNI